VVSKLRSQRIADRIREELSEMIITEVSDPRLAGVSVTDVKVDRELAFADVYVSALEGEPRAPEIIAGLQHAGGYLRSELAKRVELRVFPRLRFHWIRHPSGPIKSSGCLANCERIPQDPRNQQDKTRAIRIDPRTRVAQMDKALLEQVREALQNASRILVLSHIRPDGDAVGSLLGLGLSLQTSGKQVQMVLADGLPKAFHPLSGSDQVCSKPEGSST
jgi:ribosome-binding factor A